MSYLDGGGRSGGRIPFGSLKWYLALVAAAVLFGAGVVGLVQGPWPSMSAAASIAAVGLAGGLLVLMAGMIPGVGQRLGVWREPITFGALALGFVGVALGGLLPTLAPIEGVEPGSSLFVVFIGSGLAFLFGFACLATTRRALRSAAWEADDEHERDEGSAPTN